MLFQLLDNIIKTEVNEDNTKEDRDKNGATNK